MPELPEVETFKRKMQKVLVGKTIKFVDIHPDNIVFSGKSPVKIKEAFLGAKVKKCHRKGKYIWFETDHKLWPVFHLGMTGSYIISKEIPEDARSVKLVLQMEDGTYMIFKDPRRFGRIFLFEDPLNVRPLSELGPDVMNELPPPKVFYEALQKKKAPIKAVLMDQSFVSGIGNWMSDEILFQSGLCPKRNAKDLDLDEVKRLHAKIKSVTALSVQVGADYDKYPKTWLFHHRWGKKGELVSTGDEIRFEKVAGRTAAWVPSLQQ